MINNNFLKSLCVAGGLLTSLHASAQQNELDAWLNYERPAEYEALVAEVRPVMRDGAELDCVIAVPARDGKAVEGKFPGVVNNFNPYAALEFAFVGQIEELATLGYQALTCRVRGSGDSDGTFTYHAPPEEWNDSYDLVEWLASQPGSNGRIAFEGASYGGMTALQAAIRKPPHLVTVIPLVPASDLYLDFIYRGGVPSRPYTAGNWPLVTSLMNFPDMSPWAIWDNWYAHPNLDDFWKSTSPIHWVEEIEVPMLVAPGWADDVLPNGGIRLYEKMNQLGKQELVWMYAGAWDHDMTIFPRNVVIAWLDYWLQNREDVALPPARVVSYEMLADQDSQGDHGFFDMWPPKAAVEKAFALNGDFSLAATAKESGHVSFEQGPWSGLIGSPPTLSFSTGALSKGLVIAGDITLEVVVKFSQPHANFNVKVYEVAEGDEHLIKEGWLNLAHRDSHEASKPLPVNQQLTVNMVVGAAHHRLQSGSSLRIDISGVDTLDWTPVSEEVITDIKTGSDGSVLKLNVLGD